MNTQNLDYLKEGLRYLGFGNSLYEELEKNITAQAREFELKAHIPYYKSAVDYTLHFRKSDQSEMYFFNKYEALYRNMDPAQDKRQTFYIHKNNGITAREAYNLLNGRAVFKELVNAEGQPYKAWVQLDMRAKDQSGNYKVRQFHENYGYDLEKTLKQFYIMEILDPEQKAQLLRSLQKGNRQQVTALEGGNEVKRLIEANPRFKTINVYNEQHHQVMRETITRYGVKLENNLKQQEPRQEPTLEKQLAKRQSRPKGLSL
ncbi:hypothetical protein H7F15_12285 [Pontibacter sp. Tf4]|uniref:hypothetical protein n=1 Tax=Pontibacter sp. Tf4 TaxID=2761620 RepID=UPI0016275B69|nr:hypothetical protein [Pontibacter sp. Tf4]MBB6611820.1 hypothetical protein [Pontibacter sp. Tf4]